MQSLGLFVAPILLLVIVLYVAINFTPSSPCCSVKRRKVELGSGITDPTIGT